MSKFYPLVPKELIPNLRYRIDLRKKAQHDREMQRALMAACRHDILFWMNAFVWLYEPRPRVVDGVEMPREIPFITWPHQDRAVLKIKEYLGFEDILIEKSRGEGASWIVVCMALHDWLFKPMSAVGLVSRSEDAVDSPEDPDSLFWKIDWELTKLPRWMGPWEPKRNRTAHTLRNPDNRATTAGYSAVGDVGSGGRKGWFAMDELAKFPRPADEAAMASTQHVTNSRLIPSTPKGAHGAFYQLAHEPSCIIRVVLAWEDNPTRNRGLYKLENNVPVAIDPENNPLPGGYDPKDLYSRLRLKGFRLEDRVRSPWYDHECDRPGATKQNIAQELDRDYGGSQAQVFGSEFFVMAKKEVIAPLLRGTMTYNRETLEPVFERNMDGQVRLWMPLKAGDAVPSGSYVFGADVSTGQGGAFTSNSVLIGLNALTMEQVFEFATNTMEPADFADFSIAVCKWFGDAFLIWEHGGPGTAYTSRILTQNYPNVYRRKVEWERAAKRKRAHGWVTTKGSKQMMFDEFSRSVRTGELKLHSEALVQECGQYIMHNSKIVHGGTVATKDETSKGESHGDRVIAACVALQGVRDRPIFRVSEQGKAAMSLDTFAGRERAYFEERAAGKEDWDSRDNWGLSC